MDEILTISEVSVFLGVTKAMIYRWVKLGVIPHRKIGKQIRFSRNKLIDFQKEQRLSPKAFNPTYPRRKGYKQYIRGYIYILKTFGLYKIGKTQNITNRLQMYRQHSATIIKVIKTIRVKNIDETEKILLKMAKEMGEIAKGKEWFRLQSSDVTILKQYMDILHEN